MRITKLVMLPLVGLLLVGGCLHLRTIRTDIGPTAKGTGKFPARTAVYFSPQLEQHSKITKPETSVWGKHTYSYIMGPALQNALIKSIKTAYAEVTPVNTLPRLGEFQKIASFDLIDSKVTLEYVPGYLNQQAKATAELIIVLEIIDGSTLRTVKKFQLRGTGASTRDASGFNAYAAKHFTLAMEEAIQQLAEVTTNLLLQGAAEAR